MKMLTKSAYIVKNNNIIIVINTIINNNKMLPSQLELNWIMNILISYSNRNVYDPGCLNSIMVIIGVKI